MTLFKLQNRAAQTIANVPRRTESAPLFESLKLLTVFELYHFKICMFMFKYYTQRVAPSVKEMFTKTSDITKRDTRQSNKYYIPFTHLETVKKSLRRRGAKIWNFIFDKIDMNCSMCVFKHKIKNYLVQNQIPD